MAQIIGSILLIILVIVVVVKFKTFFIILAILAALAAITVAIIKWRKSKSGSQAELAAVVEQNIPAKPETITNAYEVTGVVFYLDNLLSLMEPNYLYGYKKQDLIDTCHVDEPIYKMTLKASRLDLTHEPDNPHDPNAIMVLLDDRLVGYMPAKSCKHILDIMDSDRVTNMRCEVYGGKYKRVDEDYDSYRDKSKYSMETGQDEYGITVYITEKNEE